MGAGAPQSVEAIELVRERSSLNMRGREYWRRTVSGESDEDVAYLARGLTYLEAKYDWIGGSVASTIWLFQELIRRKASTQLLDDLSSWVLQNTRNSYSPFGSDSLGAKSYSEYQYLTAARRVQIDQRVRADIKLEEAARHEREIRQKMAAAGAESRNTESRLEIIETLNPLPLAEQLRRISEDPKHPPQFFPTSIAAAATQQVVDSLPEEVKRELARRLKGKRKGPWGSFKKRLNRSLGQIWNKKPWWGIVE